jgi:RNA polymerase sigma-70 factor (ECF subfamily)
MQFPVTRRFADTDLFHIMSNGRQHRASAAINRPEKDHPMHAVHPSDWNNVSALPAIHRQFAASVSAVQRGYADATIVAELPTLKKYALKLTRCTHLAEDLVQDCLARALSRRHLFHSEANIRPWLFTVMHNLYISNCRQATVRTGFVKRQLATASEGREAVQEHVVDLSKVYRAINALPQEQRDVVVLVTLQELSYQEAATALGIPIGTVMSRLARGREKIRASLKFAASVS